MLELLCDCMGEYAAMRDGAGIPPDRPGRRKDRLCAVWSAYYLAMGRERFARLFLDGAFDSACESPPLLAWAGWALCGMGGEERVRAGILPRLLTIAKGRDAFYLHLLRGHLAERGGSKEALRKAAGNYRLAAAARPERTGALRAAIALDRRLGDAGALRTDTGLLREILGEQTRPPASPAAAPGPGKAAGETAGNGRGDPESPTFDSLFR